HFRIRHRAGSVIGRRLALRRTREPARGLRFVDIGHGWFSVAGHSTMLFPPPEAPPVAPVRACAGRTGAIHLDSNARFPSEVEWKVSTRRKAGYGLGRDIRASCRAWTMILSI